MNSIDAWSSEIKIKIYRFEGEIMKFLLPFLVLTYSSFLMAESIICSASLESISQIDDSFQNVTYEVSIEENDSTYDAQIRIVSNEEPQDIILSDSVSDKSVLEFDINSLDLYSDLNYGESIISLIKSYQDEPELDYFVRGLNLNIDVSTIKSVKVYELDEEGISNMFGGFTLIESLDAEGNRVGLHIQMLFPISCNH